MKDVLIVHNIAIDPDLNEALTSVGIDCYTKFPDILGRGKLSSRRGILANLRTFFEYLYAITQARPGGTKNFLSFYRNFLANCLPKLDNDSCNLCAAKRGWESLRVKTHHLLLIGA
jgi:hypothetical protein